MPPAARSSQRFESQPRVRRGAKWFELLPLLALGLVVGVIGTAAVDTGGVFPGTWQGPGPTLDEGFNVQQGTRLAVGLRAWMMGGVGWREVFGEPEDLGPNAVLGYHLPDHPPLGRLWLGVCHEAVRWCCPSRTSNERFVFAYARVGSVWAFVLTTLLVGWIAGRWFGPRAGFLAAVCVVVQPRLFAHAHIAALETCIDLAYATAVLGIAHLWGHGDETSGTNGWEPGGCDSKAGAPAGRRESLDTAAAFSPPRWGRCLLAGFFWGLALLTKVQAVFVPVAVAVWAVLRWKWRAIVPVVVFGVAGLAVFFLGWPWLWLDPPSHLWQYFARTTQRVSLQTWYAGRQWSDIRVPWHYPFVMFLVTVPIGVHLAAVYGLEAAARSWRFMTGRLGLVLLAIVVPLLVFAFPGVAVYDGTRLFSVIFPLWAVPAGLGCDRVVRVLDGRFGLWGGRLGVAAVTVLLALPVVATWNLWPCGLSYYNGLVGGLSGAQRRGFEATYWGDAVCREFVEDIVAEVPHGTRIAVVPVLHQYQVDELRRQCPLLQAHGVRLEPIDADIFNLSAVYMPVRRDPAPYVLVFRRKADLPAEWAELDAFGLDDRPGQGGSAHFADALHQAAVSERGAITAGVRRGSTPGAPGVADSAALSGALPSRGDAAAGLEPLTPQAALRRLFEPVVVFRRDGVWLAALLRLKAATRPGTR